VVAHSCGGGGGYQRLFGLPNSFAIPVAPSLFARPELAVFDPAINDAKADAVIAWAKRIKDWPTLETAVDTKIDDQAEFVAWWDSSVQSQGRKPRSSFSLTVEQAEKRTGITQQQISRWRYWLTDIDAYRERLLGAEYKAADLMEPAGTNIRGTQGTGDNEWFTQRTPRSARTFSMNDAEEQECGKSRRQTCRQPYKGDRRCGKFVLADT
jgi:hypothetical protein